TFGSSWVMGGLYRRARSFCAAGPKPSLSGLTWVDRYGEYRVALGMGRFTRLNPASSASSQQPARRTVFSWSPPRGCGFILKGPLHRQSPRHVLGDKLWTAGDALVRATRADHRACAPGNLHRMLLDV